MMKLSLTMHRPCIFREQDCAAILSGINIANLNRQPGRDRCLVNAVWAEYARIALESASAEFELSDGTAEIVKAIEGLVPEIRVDALQDGSGFRLNHSRTNTHIDLCGNDCEGIFLRIGSEYIDISELGPEMAANFTKSLFGAYDSVRRKCWRMTSC